MVVIPVVLPQEIAPVVVAVGRPHDGVDVVVPPLYFIRSPTDPSPSLATLFSP
jgi:hypothetical protein